MSLADVTGSPSICSGDMYCGVPTTMPARVTLLATLASLTLVGSSRAMPKSTTFT